MPNLDCIVYAPIHHSFTELKAVRNGIFAIFKKYDIADNDMTQKLGLFLQGCIYGIDLDNIDCGRFAVYAMHGANGVQKFKSYQNFKPIQTTYIKNIKFPQLVGFYHNSNNNAPIHIGIEIQEGIICSKHSTIGPITFTTKESLQSYYDATASFVEYVM